MEPPTVAPSDPVARARDLATTLAPLASEIETARRLPASAIAAMVEAGVFKLCVPRTLGGAQVAPTTAIDVIETLARADGSAGWIAMIGMASGLMSVYLDDAIAREVYGPADAITCGVFAPTGRATPVDDGYRVSGRWAFASGCEHSRWRMGGTLVDADPPARLPSGAPDVRCVLFRADETTIHDTWHTSGLCGTGSHDLEVRDVVVPRARTFSLLSERPRHAGYELPFFGFLASGIAAVGLGIARAALDTFVDLARSKKAPGGKRTLAQREVIQLDVARGEATLRAARGLLHATLAEATATPTLEARARLRMAACHAASQAAEVTARAYEHGGGGAIYDRSPLQRQFRDAHVVTHHLMVSSTSLAMAGRVLLGVETDTAAL